MAWKHVRLSVLALVLVAPTLLSAVAMAATPTFTDKAGNEWWVQVAVTGSPAKVQARDTNGSWVALPHQPWGDYAASFHVEPGHLVQYRATSTLGVVTTSCWFTHVTGQAGACASAPSPSPAPAPSPLPPPTPSYTVTATLDASSFAQGGAMSGRVTVTSNVDTTMPRVVLAARPPGGTNAGGPYLDVGGSSSVALKAGTPVTMSFSRAVTASDPVGSWYAFGTVQRPDGVWQDGASVAFQVTSAASSPPPTPTPTPTPTPSPAPSGKLAHTNIVSTTFWVGEIFDPTLPDGSQVCSTYDSQWAYHWSGVNKGTVPASAGGCQGSIVGGCDGVPGASSCATERRTAANGYFPTSPLVHPKENPFYLDLPYDDVNDATAFGERCSVIPWANQPGFAGHCADRSFSYMKNHWVQILGPNGSACYGQVEDAGPSHGSLYHDKNYVFGTTDAQPVQGQFNNAGMDVSPALNGCLGFKELDGQNDKVSWQFVDESQVPAGPWKTIVTTSQVTS